MLVWVSDNKENMFFLLNLGEFNLYIANTPTQMLLVVLSDNIIVQVNVIFYQYEL